MKNFAYFQSQLFKGQFENFPLLCNERQIETAVLSMSTHSRFGHSKINACWMTLSILT